MAVIRDVYYCKRRASFTVYGTVKYGRNMVPTKCVFHSPYTVVIMTFKNVYINVKDGLPSFTIIVMLDLGSICISLMWNMNILSHLFYLSKRIFRKEKNQRANA